MASFRIGFGWKEILLLTDHARSSALAEDLSADEIRRCLTYFLGHDAEMSTLRGIVAGGGGVDVSRLSDHEVIELVARRCEAGLLRLLRSTSGAPARESIRASQGVWTGEPQFTANAPPRAASGASAPRPRQAGSAVRAPIRTTPMPAPASRPTRSQPEVDPTTWIEVRLVGEDGLPIAGMSYRFTALDGAVYNGVTDQDGIGRVEGIRGAHGNFTFPTLDQDAWRHV